MRIRSGLVSAALIGLTAVTAAGGRASPPPGTSTGIAATDPSGCVVGATLGATLLFPYFEVDIADIGGVTTLISVNNGLDSPGLARLVLWTDWGVPTLAFDIYLGPLDIQTINLRSVFNGVVPSTGQPAAVSEFPFCVVLPPFHENPALTDERTLHLRSAHTGAPGPMDGLCYGADHGDSIARGYITVDSVNMCGGLESFDPANTPANTAINYFDNDRLGAIANDRNLLWGDVIFIDDRNNAAQGTEAVSLWADPIEFSGSGIYTFYGRFKGWVAHDDRVPLPSAWVQRFLNGGPFEGGADLIVFRQPNHADAAPVTCDGPPSWFPLQATITTRDENGTQLVEHDTSLLGLATQRVSIDGLEPAVAATFGLVTISGDTDQLWVQPVLTGLGRFGVGLNGGAVRTLCGEIPPTSVRSSDGGDQDGQRGSRPPSRTGANGMDR
jgi:hypothetical protein